ncbi:hypothetical protein EDB19DRAFT_892914 [Suillus lakei]|nr:hypothetical protein EDB19DRAFT_892914 [Suillus lakei]
MSFQTSNVILFIIAIRFQILEAHIPYLLIPISLPRTRTSVSAPSSPNTNSSWIQFCTRSRAWRPSCIISKILSGNWSQTRPRSPMILHQGFVSGLWRLPTEVLSQFFTPVPEPDAFEPPSELDAPMLLTRVCQRWREVALGIPSL